MTVARSPAPASARATRARQPTIAAPAADGGRKLLPYRQSLAGTLLSAREAVMAPIRPVLRDAGITEQQWRVLRVLADEGATEPSRLAESALLLGPSVSRIMRELLERGLIRRDVDPSDGRRSIVMISVRGRGLVRKAARHTLNLLDQYGDRFGVERLQNLVVEMQALTRAIRDLQSPTSREGAEE